MINRVEMMYSLVQDKYKKERNAIIFEKTSMSFHDYFPP